MIAGRKLATGVALLALMAGFGAGVNRFLASHDSSSYAPAIDPTHDRIAPQLALPGTVYFAAGGGLFALHGTSVSKLQPAGQGWMQPALVPEGGLLAVKRVANQYSDLYWLNTNGTIKQQLSHDAGSPGNLDSNNWIFYPAVGPDGKVNFSYDWPKEPPGNGYQVDFEIWSATLGATIDRTAASAGTGMTQLTAMNLATGWYTGGNVSPVPLSGGHLLYVKYEEAINPNQVSTPVPGAIAGDEVSQLRMDPKPQATITGEGTPLTQPTDDCAQPALSPSQTMMAMICTPLTANGPSTSESDLVVATFDAQTGAIGPLRRLVTGTLAAAPAWSPDGSSLVYLAPEPGDGYFQLWYLKRAGTATPSAPAMVTSGNDLDATSAPVWTS